MTKYRNDRNGDVVDVTGDDAKRLDTLDNWKKVKGSSSDGPTEIPDSDPSTDWKVDQLKAYAEAEDIDLGSASTKAEIVDAIESAKD